MKETLRPVRILTSLGAVQTSVEGTDLLAAFMAANKFNHTSAISFTAKSDIELTINGDYAFMPNGASFSWDKNSPCYSLVTNNDDELFYFWSEF